MNYEKLKEITQDKTFPLTAENENGETIIIEKDKTETNEPYFVLTTIQENNWCRINEYYEDGTVTETFEK